MARVVEDFGNAAVNAIDAGFDGVEVHGATGYLFEQFLNPHINKRTDSYGGSMENRARFMLDVIDAIIGRIGANRTGIRLSPNSTIFYMPSYSENDATYLYLAHELGKRNIAFLHFHDLGHLLNEGKPIISDEQLQVLKAAFGGAIILAGGLTQVRAEDLIARGLIDIAAFGQPYISNPDLVERFRYDLELAKPNQDTYYGGDARGYTDYPVAEYYPM